MSTARHHTEWLSLLEISGPFLSLPVLLRAFPQGLDADDPDLARSLRVAYEEWLDSQQGLRPDPALHQAWVTWVLTQMLGMDDASLLHGANLPNAVAAVTVAEHGETLHADFAVVPPPSPFAPSPTANKDAVKDVHLLVQVVPPGQALERPLSGRVWQASPATRMMTLLHGVGVPLGLLTNGEQWMLVHARPGETTGFVSWYAELWLEERLTLRAFRTLLGSRRFFSVGEDETPAALLLQSIDDQHEVTDQLGSQVRHAVEVLVQAMDRADQTQQRALLHEIDEATLYEAAVTLMMRLVFLLSAEERELLPVDDPLYAQYYAVSTLRDQLHTVADQYGEALLERRHDAWCRLLATFRAVHGGIHHDRLHLPAYGGSLFDPNRFPFLEGRADGNRNPQSAIRHSPLPIDNRTVLHLLDALQLLRVSVPGGGMETRRISFRALDIEQIGHVYEGLLDHTAVRSADPVVGLSGTRNQEPEIAVTTLEQFVSRQDEKALLDFLREQTGRSTSALRNALHAEQPDMLRAQALRAACDNDEDLYRRLLPFHGLIRDDDYGKPLIIPRGSLYVTSGTDRRASGAHYTPRSLTEPIVQHTLEPLVYHGPAEGKPRAEWTLRRPEAILALKICDKTMGSGAFLVQICRYLSERLVEALEEGKRQSAKGKSGRSDFSDSAQSVSNALSLLRAAESDEERLTLARRLVADRCLYGVDKNPLAVEMAKLSLWLITMDRGKPFTFLDHALKCGDSLVGVDLAQLSHWNLHPDQSAELFTIGLQLDIEQLVALRRQIEEMPVLDVRDQEAKAYQLTQADALAHEIKGNADLLIASYYNDLSKREQETLRAALLLVARDGASIEEKWRQHADLGNLQPFHWPLEFPEVFLSEGRSGFDAFVGNPPFMGGTLVSIEFGSKYNTLLKTKYRATNSKADLSAYFFLNAFENGNHKCYSGLIATNTISEGVTGETGLKQILNRGGIIYRAQVDMAWPGAAAVTVSVVHFSNSNSNIVKVLNGSEVEKIGYDLKFSDSSVANLPQFRYQLRANANGSFLGAKVSPPVLKISSELGRMFRESNPDIVKPCIGGQEIYFLLDFEDADYAIDFRGFTRDDAASHEPIFSHLLMSILKHYGVDDESDLPKNWWLFSRPAKQLQESLEDSNYTIACAEVTGSSTLAFRKVPSRGIVYTHKSCVFPNANPAMFAVLQSGIHAAWAWNHSSKLGTSLSYSPNDSFETFAFPQDTSSLDGHGNAYYEHRQQIICARQEGLTATYNRFHDPGESAGDIVRLRQLHVEMDNAVAASYGWGDLVLGHGFHETAQGVRYTITESARREVLARLLVLNHERYAEEEVAGLHDAKKGRGKAKKGKGGEVPDGQLGLF